MFYQIFLSPQVKRWVIITCKHGIYELPQGLPNNLRLRIFGENPHDIFAAGRGALPTQEKKKLRILEN